MNRFRQLARYASVSVIATLTSLTVLGALVATRTLTPGWANLAATAVGTVPSFELNRRWVWGRTGERSMGREVVPFALLSAAGLGLSTLTVVATGHWADQLGLATAARTLAVQAANLAGFGLLWIVQFMVLDQVLFSTAQAPEAAPMTAAQAPPAACPPARPLAA